MAAVSQYHGSSVTERLLSWVNLSKKPPVDAHNERYVRKFNLPRCTRSCFLEENCKFYEVKFYKMELRGQLLRVLLFSSVCMASVLFRPFFAGMLMHSSSTSLAVDFLLLTASTPPWSQQLPYNALLFNNCFRSPFPPYYAHLSNNLPSAIAVARAASA